MSVLLKSAIGIVSPYEIENVEGKNGTQFVVKSIFLLISLHSGKVLPTWLESQFENGSTHLIFAMVTILKGIGIV